MSKQKTAIPKTKPKATLSPDYLAAFVEASKAGVDDARFASVIAEVNGAIGRNEATDAMKAFINAVDWNGCDGDTLRGVIIALFTATVGLNELDDADENRREELAGVADQLHKQHCACCAAHEEVFAARRAS